MAKKKQYTIREFLRKHDLELHRPGHGHNETSFHVGTKTMQELDSLYVVVPRSAITEGTDPGGMILTLEAQKEATAALTEIRNQFIQAGWSEPAAEQMVITMLARAPQT